MLCRLSLLFATLVTMLTACVPVAAPAATSGAAATELTFLISGDPTDEATYQVLIDAFAAEHRDITVNLINIPSGGDFRKRLAADFAGGTPPDLFLINYRHLGHFFAAGAVEPLTDYLANSTAIDPADYYPQAMSAFQWQGVQMCMPQNISSPVIYYNKDRFDAAGVAYPSDEWTWDEFVATAQTLTRDQDGDGATDIYGFGIEPTIVRAAPFIWMNGGSIIDDREFPTRLTLDSPASKAALAWFVSLQTEYRVTPDAVAEEAEDSLSRFVNGRMAMFVDSRRAVPEFRLIEAFDWDVAALPVSEAPASVLHSDAFCIAAGSTHKDAAWTFVEFANATAGQIILAKSGRTVPSRIALAESATFLEPGAKPANSQVFLDAIPGIRSLPILENWSDIEGIVSNAIESAYYGNATLDAAIQQANEQSAEFFPLP